MFLEMIVCVTCGIDLFSDSLSAFLSMCLPLSPTLPFLFLLSVVGLALRGAGKCWLSRFAAEQEKINKVENLLKAMYFCQLLSLFVCLALSSSFCQRSNQSNIRFKSSAHTDKNFCGRAFLCPFKYLKAKTSMVLKNKGNPEGQVHVTEKLSQK